MSKPRHRPIDQRLARRAPRQARALEKVELILEAAIRLLERDGLEALNTNTLAETAGISIGTLYQYFPDKHAVLSALADREMAGLSARVLSNLQGPAPATAGERIHAILRAVLSAYGGRRRAHRQVMAHAMSPGGTSRLAPLYRKLIESTSNPASPTQTPLSGADAFVLTHAIAGVIRTYVAQDDSLPAREEVEKSLARLVLNFVQPPRPS